MPLRMHILVIPVAALLAVWLVGCGGTTTPEKKTGGTSGEHDHDHDHAHAGPHGGHLIELGEEEYHGEWTHDEASGTVTVYILDGAAKKEVPIAAEKVVIELKQEDKVTPFELAAVNRTSGDMPTAFQFEISDKTFLGQLEVLSKAGGAVLKVDINGKPFEGKITEEEHDHKH